jgi:hypothetical protein
MSQHPRGGEGSRSLLAMRERLTLPATGVAIRVAATVMGLALITAGTVWGQDDHFPFGPFRMYATSNSPDGPINVVRIESYTEADGWRRASLTPASVGMNPAEVEGQLPRFVDQPDLLGKLAATHARLQPDDEPWTAMRLVRRQYVLVDREPTDIRESVIAEWSAP